MKLSITKKSGAKILYDNIYKARVEEDYIKIYFWFPANADTDGVVIEFEDTDEVILEDKIVYQKAMRENLRCRENFGYKALTKDVKMFEILIKYSNGNAMGYHGYSFQLIYNYQDNGSYTLYLYDEENRLSNRVDITEVSSLTANGVRII